MNRAARRHLLALLERVTTPLYVLTPMAPVPPEEVSAVAAGLAGLHCWGTILSGQCDIKIVAHKTSGVRIVAGKGARRRGIRGLVPPLRIVHQETRSGYAPRWPRGSFSVSRG